MKKFNLKPLQKHQEYSTSDLKIFRDKFCSFFDISFTCHGDLLSEAKLALGEERLGEWTKVVEWFELYDKYVRVQITSSEGLKLTLESKFCYMVWDEALYPNKHAFLTSTEALSNSNINVDFYDIEKLKAKVCQKPSERLLVLTRYNEWQDSDVIPIRYPAGSTAITGVMNLSDFSEFSHRASQALESLDVLHNPEDLNSILFKFITDNCSVEIT